MASFQDLIDQIKTLRATRRAGEEDYYAGLLNLKSANTLLNKITLGITIKPTIDQAQVNQIKKQVKDVDLQVISTVNDIASRQAVEDNLATVRKQIDTLSKNITLSETAALKTVAPAALDIKAAQPLVSPAAPPTTGKTLPAALQNNTQPPASAKPATKTTGDTTPPSTPAPASTHSTPTPIPVPTHATPIPTQSTPELDLLKKDLETTKAQETQLAARVQAAGSAKADLIKKHTDLNTRKSALETKLVSLSIPAIQDKNTVAAVVDEQNRANGAALSTLTSLDTSLSQLVAQIYTDPHPRAALANLDDNTPFLLLPVRMETKFMTVADNNELWVRIYPDDIAIHSHEETLTNDEVAAGKLYWTELLVARQLNTLQDSREKNAWAYVKSLFGPQRAAWVIKSMKPTDWNARITATSKNGLIPALLASDNQFFQKLSAEAAPGIQTMLLNLVTAANSDDLINFTDQQKWTGDINDKVTAGITGFPVQAAEKTDAWSRAARSYVMPDKFVLIFEDRRPAPTNPKYPVEIPGNNIPDILYLSPEPLDKDAYTTTNDLLGVGGKCAWTTDFTLAVSNGLGFRVPITTDEAKNGFKRILALGVYLSADKSDSAAMLEELINNHHCSPKDISLVPVGTAAHGPDSKKTTVDDTFYLTEFDTPLFQPTDNTDGKRLCDALGISYAALQNVRFSDNKDFADARAMNKALYPATLGYYMQTMLNPILGVTTQGLIRDFFTNHVTARGPLASIKVGDQPYGILPTSDFTKWNYPTSFFQGPIPPGDVTTFMRKLTSFLTFLRNELWNKLIDDLPRVGKNPGDQDSAFMDVIGLQASSVEFYQRVGYSKDHLLNQDAFQFGNAYTNNINSLDANGNAVFDFLSTRLPNIFTKPPTTPQLLQIYYPNNPARLNADNLICTDPLSDKPLNPNYFTLLSAANLNQLQTQNYGPGTTTPTSLLYMMTRTALMHCLYESSYNWISNNVYKLDITDPYKPKTIIGVRADGYTKMDIMSARVGIILPQTLQDNTPVANVLLHAPLAQPESAYLAEMKDAFDHLASVDTLSLERCFTEHIDLCSYRLDAFETAVITKRLDDHRGGQPGGGIFLGAYGWVENLVPEKKTTAAAASVPQKLSMKFNTLFEHPANGGFMHAPSLAHAATAAVLRSGYMNHATPDHPDMYSVNLSSNRVETALFLVEGLKNGQSLEALLGYQFERELHDRSSADPAVNLNQYIYTFRDLYPIAHQQMPNEGAPPQETIPPDNVVNGLTLAGATLTTDTLGIKLTRNQVVPTKTQLDEIIDAINNVRDSLDAVQDLLLAENAFQLVKGNTARGSALSTSQKDAALPPDLEVINTPRGSQLMFTNKVTLHFEVLASTDPGFNPWKGTNTASVLVPMSVRAISEPGLNKWLADQLGDPTKISCKVTVIPAKKDVETTIPVPDPASALIKAGVGSAIPVAPIHVPASTSSVPGTPPAKSVGVLAPIPVPDPVFTLNELGVQPIDLLYLVTDQMDKQGISELETRISFHYRKKFTLNNSDGISIEFNPTGLGTTFANVLPLLRTCRKLLAGAKPLNAMDFTPSSAAFPPLDTANPEFYDLADLGTRVSASHAALNNLSDCLNGITRLDSLAIPKVTFSVKTPTGVPAEDTFTDLTLAGAFAELDTRKIGFEDNSVATLHISDSDILTLIEILGRISMFGVADAFPKLPFATIDNPLQTKNADKLAILVQAYIVNKRLNTPGTLANDGILSRARYLTDNMSVGDIAKSVAQYIKIAKTLFGDSYNALPRFSYNNIADIQRSDADRAQLLSFYISKNPGLTLTDVANDWMQGLSYVRPNLHKWETIRTMSGILNNSTIETRPVQLPYKNNDSWLAVEFPENDPLQPTLKFRINSDTLSITAHGAQAFQNVKQTGILIDSWTEDIPTSEETTGIAFNYNRPDNYAPQALLLAVSPTITGSWQWDSLVGVLNNTLDRAKTRTADQDKLESVKMQDGTSSFWHLLAPAIISEFSTTDANISLDFAKNLNSVNIMNYYNIPTDNINR